MITIWFLRAGAAIDKIFNIPDISSIAVIILAQTILKYHYKKIAKDYIISTISAEQDFSNEKINIKSISLLFWFGVSLIIFCITYLIDQNGFAKANGYTFIFYIIQWFLLLWAMWCYVRVSIDKPLTPFFIKENNN